MCEMKYKRLIANIIDHIAVSLITVIVVSFVIGTIIDDTKSGLGAIPFLIMIACFCPSISSGYLLFWTIFAISEGNINFIGELNPYIYIILTIVIVETVILSTVEIYTNGVTLGRNIMGIKVVNDDNNDGIVIKLILRNIVKSLGKYLFYIPFISLLFSKENKTMYDSLLKTSIIQTR